MVASHKMNGTAPDGVKPLLGEVAGTAREVVDSMSDIVWAINPERDRASDLSRRMRSFASDTLASRGVALKFDAPAGGRDRRLDLDLRRQVFLLFKEAVNNAARHSGCTEAKINLALDGKRLILEVRDNGRGFDPRADRDGHGLASMRKRAKQLGSRMEIDTAPGRGTRVVFRVPIA